MYALLFAEALAVVLLSFKKLRLAGFLFSAALMVAFTGYILLILTGYFPKRPCSCGGVLASLGWQSHFYFNLFWAVLAITGTVLEYKLLRSGERRPRHS
ncbi:MAG: hypothetical protein EOO89_31245 [Pedobacter sp.]|nr:MAG: hypothetical protein EOO89_31245 [Pedobacter sp.]